MFVYIDGVEICLWLLSNALSNAYLQVALQPGELLSCAESTERRFTVLSAAALLEGVESLTDVDIEDWNLYSAKPENAGQT